MTSKSVNIVSAVISIVLTIAIIAGAVVGLKYVFNVMDDIESSMTEDTYSTDDTDAGGSSGDASGGASSGGTSTDTSNDNSSVSNGEPYEMFYSYNGSESSPAHYYFGYSFNASKLKENSTYRVNYKIDGTVDLESFDLISDDPSLCYVPTEISDDGENVRYFSYTSAFEDLGLISKEYPDFKYDYLEKKYIAEGSFEFICYGEGITPVVIFFELNGGSSVSLSNAKLIGIEALNTYVLELSIEEVT